MKTKLYPRMNAKIVSLLRISGHPHSDYAAAYIENLEAQRDILLNACHLVIDYPNLNAAKHCRKAVGDVQSIDYDLRDQP